MVHLVWPKTLATQVRSYYGIHITFTVWFEKPDVMKNLSFVSSIMQNTVASGFRSRAILPGKQIYCIVFRSASSTCCLLNSVASILKEPFKLLKSSKQTVV